MDYLQRGSKFGKFRMLKSAMINVSSRRFKAENRFVLGVKYLLVPFHRFLLGEIRSDIFNYKFGHYRKE